MESKIKELEDLSALWKTSYIEALENLNYAQADHIGAKRVGLNEAIRVLKEPSNTQIQIDAPIIRCAGCGCILNDPLCVDCGELPPGHD